MTKARVEQISLDETPFYHCYSRCVRRAFLCGIDRDTGASFEHRKQWIVDRMKQLSGVFCMDICAYAVMDNHYHVVLRVDTEEADALSVEGVLERWTSLFGGNLLAHRYLSGQPNGMSDAELDAVHGTAEKWRARLVDISWFMRCLNEYIARLANKEDGCRGRFWEGRFKSQALLDDVAVLACMAYVDLNPVRAGLAKTPESSDYTAIQERIRVHVEGDAKSAEPVEPNVESKTHSARSGGGFAFDASSDGMAKPLLDFVGNECADQAKGIAYYLQDYLQLLDWTGRAILDGKRAAIPERLPPILERLRVNPAQWVMTVTHFHRRFPRMAGNLERLRVLCDKLNLRWLHGVGPSKLLYVD